jgi:chorismate mutase
MKLEESRKKIDAIDTEILILLNRRAEISKEIGVLKLGAGLPIVDPEREDDIIRRIARENEGTMQDKTVVGIYQAILGESRRIQEEVMVTVEEKGAFK